MANCGKQQNDTGPSVVEFAIFQGFALSELASAIEIFRQFQQTSARQAYTLRVVSPDSQVISDTGVTVAADRLEPTLAPPDLFVLIGGAGVAEVLRNEAHLELARERIAVVRRVAAIAAGVGILLHSERVLSHRVVAHWQLESQFASLRENVQLNCTNLFIHDDWLWTAASSSASIDMFLEMLSSDHGAEQARMIARRLTLGQIRCGAQRQISPSIDLYAGHGVFDRLHAHIQENIRSKFSLDDLAEFCGMSPRNFMRRYHETMGNTPAKVIDKMRAEAAAELMLQRDWPSKRLFQLCGFGSEETMRRSFARNFGMSPKEYRRHQLDADHSREGV